MRAAIALGSNLPSRFGDRTANLLEAVHRLGDIGRVVAVSGFHSTEPVGYTDQPQFLNGAALVATDLSPTDLLRALLAIERSIGRVRDTDLPPKGPRIIDLDLLLYEDDQGHSSILSDPELILPHPEMAKRAFVLEPLVEIAPDMQHPLSGLPMRKLLAALRTEQAGQQPATGV